MDCRVQKVGGSSVLSVFSLAAAGAHAVHARPIAHQSCIYSVCPPTYVTGRSAKEQSPVSGGWGLLHNSLPGPPANEG